MQYSVKVLFITLSILNKIILFCVRLIQEMTKLGYLHNSLMSVTKLLGQYVVIILVICTIKLNYLTRTKSTVSFIAVYILLLAIHTYVFFFCNKNKLQTTEIFSFL